MGIVNGRSHLSHSQERLSHIHSSPSFSNPGGQPSAHPPDHQPNQGQNGKARHRINLGSCRLISQIQLKYPESRDKNVTNPTATVGTLLCICVFVFICDWNKSHGPSRRPPLGTQLRQGFDTTRLSNVCFLLHISHVWVLVCCCVLYKDDALGTYIIVGPSRESLYLNLSSRATFSDSEKRL